MNDERFTLITEGKVRLWVPNPKNYLREDGVYEPSWAPVFYNPLQVLNRDLTVLALAVLKNSMKHPIHVLDAFSGTGIRALRIAVEIGGADLIIANDLSKDSFILIRKNISLNRVGDVVKPSKMEANALMYLFKSSGKTFSFIDIDPFGTPEPFIDAAIWSVRNGGFLGVTATDTAPLSGNRWRAGSRRYDVRILRFDVPHYLGLRVLLGYIGRRAASRDRFIKPLISFTHKHYYRVIFKVSRGAGEADRMLNSKIGYILYCPDSGFRTLITEPISLISLTSTKCGPNLKLLGPLWIGELGDSEFIRQLLGSLGNKYTYLSSYKELLSLLNILIEESALTNTFDLVSVSRTLRVNTPKIKDVLDCLKAKGFAAVRSHLCRSCVSSDAGWEDIKECVAEMARPLKR